MTKIKKPGLLAGSAVCIILAAGPAMARSSQIDGRSAADGPPASLQIAARGNAQSSQRVYRLIGSHVLNLSGERIGRVEDLTFDDIGKIAAILIALKDSIDMDSAPIAVSPYRAQVVSTTGTHVAVIRVDLTREEIVQAQLARLKNNARAPVQRETDRPDAWRQEDPLF